MVLARGTCDLRLESKTLYMRRARQICPRLVLVTALFAGLSFCAQKRTITECTEYYESRVAYLLGCCGDVPIADYPGPRFPYPMDEAELGTQALKEVDAARKSGCYKSGSAAAKTLALNAIGAHLMRARARSHSASASYLDAAVRDADLAARDLRSFIVSYPKSAVRIWYWLAMSFRRSGRPWEALRFVSGLPESVSGQKEAFLGDLYFDLAMFDAASEHYSRWLQASGTDSLCGYHTSIKNAAELRGLGFKIPPAPQSQGVCVSLGDWQPYAGFPEH
jgi:hypothetical protein